METRTKKPAVTYYEGTLRFYTPYNLFFCIKKNIFYIGNVFYVKRSTLSKRKSGSGFFLGGWTNKNPGFYCLNVAGLLISDGMMIR